MEVLEQIKLKKIIIFILSIFILIIFTACFSSKIEQKKLAKKAIEFMDKNEYNLALENFNLALNLGDKNKNLYKDILLNKALAEFYLEKYSDSTKSLKKLEQFDKKESSKDRYKALLIMNLSQDKNNFKQAYDLILDFTKEDINSKYYNIALNEFLTSIVSNIFTNKEYTNFDLQVIRNLNKKEYLKNKNVHNLFNMGLFEFIDKNYDKALEYFEKSRKIANEKNITNLDKTILLNMAICYEYKLEVNKAIELFEEYINKYGTDDTIEHELLFLKSRLIQN